MSDQDDLLKYFNPEEDLAFDENEEQLPESYNYEKAFNEQITPLLKSIINLCREYDMPMLAVFQYQNSKHKSVMSTNINLPQARTCTMLLNAANVLLD